MDFAAARARLIDQLHAEIKDEPVLSVMSRIPREKFVPPESQHLAYEDIPLPIGYNQTISQPFIIALMTASLELTGKEKVLEVGTGSGYQAAILAELTHKVVTVERVAGAGGFGKTDARETGLPQYRDSPGRTGTGLGKRCPVRCYHCHCRCP